MSVRPVVWRSSDKRIVATLAMDADALEWVLSYLPPNDASTLELRRVQLLIEQPYLHEGAT